MAHYTLIAGIAAGNGQFPFLNVQLSKNHPLIAIKGATVLRGAGPCPVSC